MISLLRRCMPRRLGFEDGVENGIDDFGDQFRKKMKLSKTRKCLLINELKSCVIISNIFYLYLYYITIRLT